MGCPTVRARFQNVYGPGEILGAGDGAGRRRPSGATSRRLRLPGAQGPAARLDNGGIASRDFIYVEDIVARAHRLCRAGAPGDVYNLASGVETTIRSSRPPISRSPAGSSELRSRRGASGIARAPLRLPAKSARELGFAARCRSPMASRRPSTGRAPTSTRSTPASPATQRTWKVSTRSPDDGDASPPARPRLALGCAGKARAALGRAAPESARVQPGGP